MKNNITYILLGACMLSWTACDSDLWKLEDENKGAFVAVEYEPISTMLENSGEHDEWVKVLNYSGSYSVLNSIYSGSNSTHFFAHFAPSDSAMQAFYASKQVNGIEDLGVEYARAMVQTMTYDPDEDKKNDSLALSLKFTADIETYSWESECDEVVSCHIDTVQGGFSILNESGKDWVHVERNYIKCTNGFVYQTTGVLTPLVETVYDRIAQSGNSSIMLEALKATGYDKQLDVVSDTTYTLGNQTITKHIYTFLNVTDDVFQASGISSLSDLKSAIVNHASDKAANPDSLLKQYVLYHIFDDIVSRENLLNKGGDTVSIRESMAKNQIMMVSRQFLYYRNYLDNKGTEKVDTVYNVLFNTDDIANQSIDSLNCDIIAKNGLVHNLTGWMPVYEPKQATVVWELTAYSEVRQKLGVDYQPATLSSTEVKQDLSGLSCYKVEMGPDGKTNSTYTPLCYVTCKSNLKNCLHNDRLVINLGYQGSVAMSTPTLVKGKYRVSITMAYLPEQSFIRTLNGCKGGMMRVSIDGENSIITSPYTTITKSLSGTYEATLYDEVEFTETNSHEFKFVILDPAASSNNKFSLQFDVITFTPIE